MYAARTRGSKKAVAVHTWIAIKRKGADQYQIAQIFGWYESLGLGIEFDTQFQENVAQVTPEMAQKVAGDYLIEPYISIVGSVKL